MHVFPMRRKVPVMLPFTPPSPDARARLTRRGLLTLPTLAGAGIVLAGCGVLKKDGSVSSGKTRVLRPRVLLPPRLAPMGG